MAAPRAAPALVGLAEWRVDIDLGAPGGASPRSLSRSISLSSLADDRSDGSADAAPPPPARAADCALAALPADAALRVLALLPVQELCAAGATCRWLRELAAHRSLWHVRRRRGSCC